MKDGFVKAAVCTPALQVADCTYNTSQIIHAADVAIALGAKILVTPELSITGATCGDLYYQSALLDGAMASLADIVAASVGKELLYFVGMPLCVAGRLYNVAVCIANGTILGVTPKSYPSSPFAPADDTLQEITLLGQICPFGRTLLYRCDTMPDLTIGVEIGSDLFAPCPPSQGLAMAGASVIVNLSADCETAGRDAYRRSMALAQSARLSCGYLLANAGPSESTTDMVFAGGSLIVENGIVLAEATPYEEGLTVSELDVSMLLSRRMCWRSSILTSAYSVRPFTLAITDTTLTRSVPTMPFIPADKAEAADLAEQILAIQAQGLKKRISHARCKTAVIGISGGLDSCLALLAAVEAMDLLDRPRTDIVAVTMPCFGTTKRTKGNAEVLCELLGVTLRVIDIKASVELHFVDISHDKNDRNVVYENAQARERTQILMDIANQTGGMVVGTGDLSELALGWATYNGDQMSMYGVNASIPKTQVRYLVRHFAETTDDTALKDVLLDILATPVSPELLPADDEVITQETESIVGPYELHDFYLYYLLKYGFSPKKVLRLAEFAFDGVYDRKTILYWLRTFLRRFFTQQFKRSCLPDGPKVADISLSPRGGWTMPSDAVGATWIDNLTNME